VKTAPRNGFFSSPAKTAEFLAAPWQSGWVQIKKKGLQMPVCQLSLVALITSGGDKCHVDQPPFSPFGWTTDSTQQARVA
jgi:hypothetical protein